MTIDAAGVGYSGSCKVNVAHAGDDYVYYNKSKLLKSYLGE